MVDDTPVFERFVTLAKRELQADDVRMLSLDESVPDAENVLVTRLNDGRHVVATFATAPKDRDALERRLSMLASTFADALASPPSEKQRARPRPWLSLHEELKALAARARAVDVVVIDTDSPVVWGCASVPARPRARNELLLRDVSDRELSSRVDDESGPLHQAAGKEPSETASSQNLLHLTPKPPQISPVPMESARVVSKGEHRLNQADSEHDLGRISIEIDTSAAGTTVPPKNSRVSEIKPDQNDDDEDAIGREEEEDRDESEVARRAITAVRALPALDGLHKGRHLRHLERDGNYYLALSFSGIYILCIVFDGDFDELRAERAAADALPRIERLVLALPPLDPDPPQPMGGVVALRRGRRR